MRILWLSAILSAGLLALQYSDGDDPYLYQLLGVVAFSAFFVFIGFYLYSKRKQVKARERLDDVEIDAIHRTHRRDLEALESKFHTEKIERLEEHLRVSQTICDLWKAIEEAEKKRRA